ncbi:hypothetical protein MJO28_011636 [Puccinia striiformis f. sp. tritici]|uniref:Uncharacterized protein n=1 Tax=Puccinia striiformis f. sp. tritici TaxID=168172 RepID=A0ACC0E5R3_9BASI|nr:hypothetical protein MJO28_011636 [Puccinia striiformis f. sp. tritici]
MLQIKSVISTLLQIHSQSNPTYYITNQTCARDLQLCPMSGYFNYWHILLPGGFCQEQNFPAGQSSWSQKSCGLSAEIGLDPYISQSDFYEHQTKSLGKLEGSKVPLKVVWQNCGQYYQEERPCWIGTKLKNYPTKSQLSMVIMSSTTWLVPSCFQYSISPGLNAWKIQGASVLQLGQLASAQVGTPLDLSGGANLQFCWDSGTLGYILFRFENTDRYSMASFSRIYSPINQMPIHITSDELLKPYCGLIGKGYSLVNWDCVSCLPCSKYGFCIETSMIQILDQHAVISQKIAAPIAKGQTSSA